MCKEFAADLIKAKDFLITKLIQNAGDDRFCVKNVCKTILEEYDEFRRKNNLKV